MVRVLSWISKLVKASIISCAPGSALFSHASRRPPIAPRAQFLAFLMTNVVYKSLTHSDQAFSDRRLVIRMVNVVSFLGKPPLRANVVHD